MGQQKTLVCFWVLLLLCLPWLPSLGAVPVSSRSFAPLRIREAPVMETAGQVIDMEGRLVQEEFERMDISRDDYPGTGPNPHHDPKSPGRP